MEKCKTCKAQDDPDKDCRWCRGNRWEPRDRREENSEAVMPGRGRTTKANELFTGVTASLLSEWERAKGTDNAQETALELCALVVQIGRLIRKKEEDRKAIFLLERAIIEDRKIIEEALLDGFWYNQVIAWESEATELREWEDAASVNLPAEEYAKKVRAWALRLLLRYDILWCAGATLENPRYGWSMEGLGSHVNLSMPDLDPSSFFSAAGYCEGICMSSLGATIRPFEEVLEAMWAVGSPPLPMTRREMEALIEAAARKK